MDEDTDGLELYCVPALEALTFGRRVSFLSFRPMLNDKEETEMDTNQAAQVADFIVRWLRETAAESQTKGYVVGLSGGIDSSVVALLCRKAFPENTLGLIMHCQTDPKDAADARRLADRGKLPCEEVFLDRVYGAFIEAVRATPGGDPALALANIKPRLRMTALYYYANRFTYLVAGTTNRSEMKVGYFTKYGDGGVDVEPIIHLTKGQVRDLGRYLGVPDEIIIKPPSAGLWKNQTDEGELGLTYAVLDHYLVTGEADPAVRERIEHLSRISEHKRHPPSIPPPPPGLNYRIGLDDC